MTVTDDRKLAREFVVNLMRDAAGPNTGNLATDAEAWPNCGIHQDELIERVYHFEREVRLEEANLSVKIVKATAFRAHSQDDVDFHSGCVQTQERVIKSLQERIAALERKEE